MNSVESSLEQLRKLADKRKKSAFEARVVEPVIAAALAWFLCGSLAFGIGLLTTGFVKAVGLSIILSIVGAVLGFWVLSNRIYRQVAEQVNAEFAKPMAEAKKAAETKVLWPQFIVPAYSNDGYYIRRDSEETAYIVRRGGEAAFGWGVIVQDNMEKGQYKVVTETEAKAVLQ